MIPALSYTSDILAPGSGSSNFNSSADGSGFSPETVSLEYAFTVEGTPEILSVSPQEVKQHDTVLIEVKGLSVEAKGNTLTIGGKVCASSYFFSKSPTAQLVDSSLGYIDNTIGCKVPVVDPGRYRILLHVAGRGWAYGSISNTVILVQAVITGPPSHTSGSLRGGLLLSIPIHGLGEDAVERTHVTIGSTPCTLQSINEVSSAPQTGTMSCLTQHAQDDGYSSLVTDSALLHWSFQRDFFNINGSYSHSESNGVFYNNGRINEVVLAKMVGDVQTGMAGISGNNITDQSVLFDGSSYIRVNGTSSFSNLSSFSFELWLKFSDSSVSSQYTPVLSFLTPGDNTDPKSRGAMLVLNPCSQLEFWLSTIQDLQESDTYLMPDSDFGSTLGTEFGSGLGTGCNLIMDKSQCPSSCTSGTFVHSPVTSTPGIPKGEWSILTGPAVSVSDSPWNHLVFGFEAATTGSVPLSSTNTVYPGKQVLFFNKHKYESKTAYNRADITPIEIGGTSVLPEGSSSNSHVAQFTGYIDEVSLFDYVLSEEDVSVHHHYGTTEDQPIWVVSEAFDGVGQGMVPDLVYAEWEPVLSNVSLEIDWDEANGGVYILNVGDGVRFHWTG